jgi:peptidoglycan-associated lipoprotein
MKFALMPVLLAFALVACKSPVKVESASAQDTQVAAAAAEKNLAPIAASNLVKDASSSARNVAALDLSAKGANASGVGTGSLVSSKAAETALGSASTAGSVSAPDTASSESAAAARVAAAAAAAAEKANADALVLTQRIVYFDFDSYIVRSEARPIIEAHARRLRNDIKLRIVLEGNTDERGGREYNLGLGQKRADAVRKALSLLGVADSQMEAVSFGKEKPADPGNSEAAMQKNRRVEINYR